MNWQALWNDGPIISVHALVAILAMAVGAVQLAAPKGTLRHRWLGFVWVGAMAVVALSSFWSHEFRWWGPFSIIHVLSLLVLATLVYSIGAMRRGKVVAHRDSNSSTATTTTTGRPCFSITTGSARAVSTSRPMLRVPRGHDRVALRFGSQ